MFRWLAGLFGLEYIKTPPPNPPTLRTRLQGSLQDWPEGSQIRKQKRFHEPDGWAHCSWSWRSNGYIDYPGSLYPKVGKAECRNCLGVLKCCACEKLVRPSTKTADMNAQLNRGCPECADRLLWIKCNARTYHFVIEENGTQYSVWEHNGSHLSHPRPPAGRRPPRSVPRPPHHSQTSVNTANGQVLTQTKKTRHTASVSGSPTTEAFTSTNASPYLKHLMTIAACERFSGSNDRCETTDPVSVDAVGWRDEKYLHVTSIVIAQPLTRSLALDSTPYSESVTKANGILQKLIQGMGHPQA